MDSEIARAQWEAGCSHTGIELGSGCRLLVKVKSPDGTQSKRGGMMRKTVLQHSDNSYWTTGRDI